MATKPIQRMEYAKYDTRLEVSGRRFVCKECGVPLHEHDKERRYPDDGPAGSYHYRYRCADGTLPELVEKDD